MARSHAMHERTEQVTREITSGCAHGDVYAPYSLLLLRSRFVQHFKFTSFSKWRRIIFHFKHITADVLCSGRVEDGRTRGRQIAGSNLVIFFTQTNSASFILVGRQPYERTLRRWHKDLFGKSWGKCGSALIQWSVCSSPAQDHRDGDEHRAIIIIIIIVIILYYARRQHNTATQQIQWCKEYLYYLVLHG